MEIKKSYRLDGLFVPRKLSLPLYFVEVQYRRKRAFYPNLFAKVFSFLEANDPDQEWIAVAIFPNREAEAKRQHNCEDLISSRRMRRIYLKELAIGGGAPPGLTILQLATCPKEQTPELVSELVRRARDQEAGCEDGGAIINLTEEVLMRRFTNLNREEIRRMFKLHDIRKSRAWQEIHEEGVEAGMEKRDRERDGGRIGKRGRCGSGRIWSIA